MAAKNKGRVVVLNGSPSPMSVCISNIRKVAGIDDFGIYSKPRSW